MYTGMRPIGFPALRLFSLPIPACIMFIYFTIFSYYFLYLGQSFDIYLSGFF